MNLEFFDRTIKGDWMPHLIDNDNPHILISAIKLNEYVLFDDSLTDTRAEIRNGNYIEFIITDEENWINKLSMKVVKEKSQVNYKDIIPEPPNHKCYCYYYLINFHKKQLISGERLAFKYLLMKESVNTAMIEFVDYLKILFRDAIAYSSAYYNSASDQYIVNLLKDTLIEIIQYFQNSYNYLFQNNSKSYNELLKELSTEKSSSRIIESTSKKNESLYDFLRYDNNDQLISVLSRLFKDLKNKETALMILALKQNDWILDINAGLYRAINNTLGFNCQPSGLNRILTPSSITKVQLRFSDTEKVKKYSNQINTELEKFKISIR